MFVVVVESQRNNGSYNIVKLERKQPKRYQKKLSIPEELHRAAFIPVGQ
jgi:hypothetical protein